MQMQERAGHYMHIEQLKVQKSKFKKGKWRSRGWPISFETEKIIIEKYETKSSR